MNELVPRSNVPVIQPEAKDSGLRIVNPVPPSGEPYWLWIDGQLTPDELWGMMDQWPTILGEATVSLDYTVIIFRGGRPPDREVNPLVGKRVFVLQGDSRCKVMFCNTDLTPEMAKKLRALLDRLGTLRIKHQPQNSGQRSGVGLQLLDTER